MDLQRVILIFAVIGALTVLYFVLMLLTKIKSGLNTWFGSR